MQLAFLPTQSYHNTLDTYLNMVNGHMILDIPLLYHGYVYNPHHIDTLPLPLDAFPKRVHSSTMHYQNLTHLETVTSETGQGFPAYPNEYPTVQYLIDQSRILNHSTLPQYIHLLAQISMGPYQGNQMTID